MNVTQIKGAIMLATGLDIPQYADSLGVARSTVYNVIKGTARTKAVQEAISKDLSQVGPVSLTWPIKKAAA